MITLLIVVSGLFGVILALMEIGRRVGVRRRHEDPDGSHAGLGAIEGAVFGLMGLLIAFTFSGAAARFDARRQLIGDESNAIGTAYLRIDLLPVAEQPALREDFRNYLDARIEYFKNLDSNAEAAKAALDNSVALQKQIWDKSVIGCAQVNFSATTSLVLSSLNAMIDITTTRAVALQTHPPKIIYWGLAVLVFASALLAGYSLGEAKTRSWLHLLLFSSILAISLYVIFDLEYPRAGLIRIETADRVLRELRSSMK